MAVRRKDETQGNGNGKGKIKFRYTDEERTVQFSMENITSESVVSEGLRGLANALAGRNVTDPARRLPKNAGGAPPVVEEEELDTEQAIPEEEDEAPEEIIEANGNGSERKRRIPPDPKIIHDLDITSGSVPLRTFIEQKGPRKAQDRIVVVAVWLKKHKNYEEVSRDHLYTCYQQMGGSGDWKSPNDFEPLLRQLGKRKGWFDKGTAEAYKVTIVASNYVDGMTPAAA